MNEQFSDLQERAMPHAVGAEKSVLSSILKEPSEFIPLAMELGLTSEHFYLPANSIIFSTAVEIHDRDKAIELVSLVQHMLDHGQLDRCGGPANLTDLYLYAPTPIHFHAHLRMVKDKHILRQLIAHGIKTVEAAYDAPADVYATLDEAERDVMAIRDQTAVETVVDVKTAISQVHAEIMDLMEGRRKNLGMTTGFPDLDRMTLGMKAGEMFVIAARPSMGKTALATGIIEHVIFDLAESAMFFSCEMPIKQICQRIIGSRAKLNFLRLADGRKLDKGELSRIQTASMALAGAKITIDDTSQLQISALRAKARRAASRKGVKLIVVDYLQLLRSKSRQAEGSREREISEISGGLKALAKELGVPILVLAQLNRESEKRAGKSKGVPRMSDLRESGAIEQDADLVGLLHRDDYFAEDDSDRAKCEGRAKLIIAKNRNGPTGDVPLTWMPELIKFEPGFFPKNAPKEPKEESRYK